MVSNIPHKPTLVIRKGFFWFLFRRLFFFSAPKVMVDLFQTLTFHTHHRNLRSCQNLVFFTGSGNTLSFSKTSRGSLGGLLKWHLSSPNFFMEISISFHTTVFHKCIKHCTRLQMCLLTICPLYRGINFMHLFPQIVNLILTTWTFNLDRLVFELEGIGQFKRQSGGCKLSVKAACRP